jgi:hypothetical protein
MKLHYGLDWKQDVFVSGCCDDGIEMLLPTVSKRVKTNLDLDPTFHLNSCPIHVIIIDGERFCSQTPLNSPILAGGFMDSGILLDEIHITFFLPANLPTDQIDSIRQILLDPSFLIQL